MTGRTLVFWLFVFIGLWFFFWSFGTSTFQRQEEVQLFIPEWVVIRDMLSVPGGFCTVVGQALVQYYTASLFVLCVNSIFLCVAGFLCYLLLQEIAPRGYNLLLALFPVLGLLKAHTSSFYVLDGTVGLILLLLFSYVFIRIRRMKVQLFYGVVSVSYLWFDWPVGGTLRSGRGLHESFVPKEEMVWFACCVFGWGVVGLYRYSFGYRYSVDRRDLFGKVSGVPVAAGFLCLFYLDPFCRLASDSVCNGLYDEGSSQRKAFGESICCGKLVGRPVLLFRILSARTV